jgi:hypothetical protein
MSVSNVSTSKVPSTVPVAQVPTAKGPEAPKKQKALDRMLSPLTKGDGFIAEARRGMTNGAVVGAGSMGLMAAFFGNKKNNVGKNAVIGAGTGIVVGAASGAISRMTASAITDEHKEIVGAAVGAIVTGVGMRLLGGKGSTGLSQIAVGALTGFFSSH